jgi:hypothetical protein
MSVEHFDEFHVRQALTRACAELGGDFDFARLHKLNIAHVIAVRKGDACPSFKLLVALGYEPITRYVKVG